MKILLLLICFVFAIGTLFCVCESSQDALTNSEATETAAPDNVIFLDGQYPNYKTLKELIDDCDYVIIGKVIKVLPTIRENISASSDEGWANYTPVKILIKKILVGNKNEDEYISIRQPGGSYTGISENGKQETITEIADSVIFLEEETTYLMFVGGENNAEKGVQNPYYLIPPSIINPKIVDDKLVIIEGNNLFKNGTSIEDAIAMIEEAMKSADAAE